jgi:Fic family protein
MSGARGDHATPGEFRKTQTWNGAPGASLNEAQFVPPPVEEMQESLADWEKFLNAKPPTMPALVQAAVIHYQFEAIHPFLDGNGRVGRLLLTLFLAERKILPEPLLYVSAFFERYRSEYYDLLMGVSARGEWAAWIAFFLRAVRTQAREAISRVERILALREQYRERVMKKKGKGSASLVKLVEELFVMPATTIASASLALGTTPPAAQNTVEKLVELGILSEVTGRQRGRLYIAREVFAVTTEDLKPGSEFDD